MGFAVKLLFVFTLEGIKSLKAKIDEWETISKIRALSHNEINEFHSIKADYFDLVVSPRKHLEAEISNDLMQIGWQEY